MTANFKYVIPDEESGRQGVRGIVHPAPQVVISQETRDKQTDMLIARGLAIPWYDLKRKGGVRRLLAASAWQLVKRIRYWREKIVFPYQTADEVWSEIEQEEEAKRLIHGGWVKFSGAGLYGAYHLVLAAPLLDRKYPKVRARCGAKGTVERVIPISSDGYFDAPKCPGCFKED